MGIKDLYTLIKDRCPEQLSIINLKEIPGYRIAVDISIFLYKFIRSSGEDGWATSFFMLLCSLKRNRIKAICIFDGPNPPIEKAGEQAKRREQTAKSRVRLEKAKVQRDTICELYFKKEKEVVDEKIQANVKVLYGKPRKKTRLNTDWSDPQTCLNAMNDLIERLTRQTLPITSKHTDLAKRIVRALGLGCMEAPGEAETLCAYMAVKGMVDAVLTEDTDVLAYGTPIMLAYKDKRVSDEELYCIHHPSLVKALEMDEMLFRDLCILLKCDYNDRIKGIPPDGRNRKKPVCIGWKGAILMIQTYGQLELCSKYIEDITPLKYERCRVLLTIPKAIPHTPIPINSELDIDELISIMELTKTSVTLEFIEECWKPVEITFTDFE